MNYETKNRAFGLAHSIYAQAPQRGKFACANEVRLCTRYCTSLDDNVQIIYLFALKNRAKSGRAAKNHRILFAQNSKKNL